MNVKVPQIGEQTLKLAGNTLENIIKSPTEPLFNFLEENEEVFNGDISYKINNYLRKLYNRLRYAYGR